MSQIANPGSLIARMRARTAGLHAHAEQTGIVSAIVSGSVRAEQYALYLRNLLPTYDEMERWLQLRSKDPAIAPLASETIMRHDALIWDLDHLAGSEWRSLPVLNEGTIYAARVQQVGADARLIAHAYTRYLGDLNGGRILHARLVQMFGQSAFTHFPGIPDQRVFAAAYRDALDRACPEGEMPTVVEEAAVAFEINIALSEAIGLESVTEPEQGKAC